MACGGPLRPQPSQHLRGDLGWSRGSRTWRTHSRDPIRLSLCHVSWLEDVREPDREHGQSLHAPAPSGVARHPRGKAASMAFRRKACRPSWSPPPRAAGRAAEPLQPVCRSGPTRSERTQRSASAAHPGAGGPTSPADRTLSANRPGPPRPRRSRPASRLADGPAGWRSRPRDPRRREWPQEPENATGGGLDLAESLHGGVLSPDARKQDWPIMPRRRPDKRDQRTPRCIIHRTRTNCASAPVPSTSGLSAKVRFTWAPARITDVSSTASPTSSPKPARLLQPGPTRRSPLLATTSWTSMGSLGSGPSWSLTPADPGTKSRAL